MRSRPSTHTILTLLAAPIAVIALAGCVDSAEPDTTDTIAPLPTSTTLVSTITTLPATVPTVLIGGTAATSPTLATTPTVETEATEDTEPVDTTPVVGVSTYVVVANDTLFGIAKKCDTSASKLAEYNRWSDGVNHSIFPGDEIAMPCTPAVDTSASTTTVAGATATSAGGTTGASTTTTFDPSTGGTYTVLQGDTLSGIAVKTGTTVDAIVQANGWASADQVIIPGQKIKLPAKQ